MARQNTTEDHDADGSLHPHFQWDHLPEKPGDSERQTGIGAPVKETDS